LERCFVGKKKRGKGDPRDSRGKGSKKKPRGAKVGRDDSRLGGSQARGETVELSVSGSSSKRGE